MTHTQFLARLGAPLKNRISSWGSIRESDQAVFLLTFQDRVSKIGESQCQFIELTDYDKLKNEPKPTVGARERLQHIDLIKSGSTCYLVICIAKDTSVRPRTVKDFDRDFLFRAGKL